MYTDITLAEETPFSAPLPNECLDLTTLTFCLYFLLNEIPDEYFFNIAYITLYTTQAYF